MKLFLFIYFIFSATLSYCQKSSSDEFSMSADSFLIAMNKKNDTVIGRPFPEFSVVFRNTEYSNKTLKGKVIFINFWFAACPPCMAEMRALNDLFTRFRHNKNFEFLSFTFDDPGVIDSIRKKYAIQYNIFSISRDECYRLNNNNGFPTSIILNTAELIQYIHPGDDLNGTKIKKYFSEKVYPLLLKEL